jgi:hypothetical protein
MLKGLIRMNEEKKFRKLEERLLEIINWGFRVQQEPARTKRLYGEIIEVFQGGNTEYIMGRPYRARIATPEGKIGPDLTVYKYLVEQAASKEQADEAIGKYNKKIEVEEHALYNGHNQTICTFVLPSRHFLKEVNPYYPEQNKDKPVKRDHDLMEQEEDRKTDTKAETKKGTKTPRGKN